ncbi:MAG: DNA-processing protein DprA [Litorivicinus sp.]
MDDLTFWRYCQVRGQSAADIKSGQNLKRATLDPERVRVWMRARQRMELIRCVDAHYPQALWQLPRPPKQLWCLGRVDLLARPGTAIVGSRDASVHGRSLARLASQAAGEVVISGGARGVDQAAHEAAEPDTIAVMGGGLNHLFPPQCHDLLRRLSHSGLVVSEHFPDVPPRAGLFPLRNRLIAALCRRLLVVEGTHKSGSLITAQYALELDRELWAVPGSPLNPQCQGPNRLIRDGALPFTEPEDWHSLSLDSVEPADPIQQALAGNPHTPTELAAHLNWALPQVLERLMALQMAGQVEARAGRYAWKF